MNHNLAMNEYSKPMSIEVEKGVYQSILMRMEKLERNCIELMNDCLANGNERGAIEMQLHLNQLKRDRENLRKPGEPRRP